MQYDKTYGRVEHYFGDQPEELLKDHYHRINKTGRVLDLGVGQGRHALFLARKGYSVDAIDPSKVAVELVSAAAAKEHLPIRADSTPSRLKPITTPQSSYSG
jgi:tellurite methyltransferase